MPTIHARNPQLQASLMFADHPSAVNRPKPDTGLAWITVRVPDGYDHSGWYQLSHIRDGDSSIYNVRHYGGTESFTYTDEPLPPKREGVTGLDMAGAARAVLAHGVAVPRNGALYGWVGPKRTIAALVIIYSDEEKYPDGPGWSVMPLAGLAEEAWPPITTETLNQGWDWQYTESGRLVPAWKIIQANPGVVFYVNNPDLHPSGVIAAARDARGPGGYKIPAGVFTYWHDDDFLPPTRPEVLVHPDRVDLVDRFPASNWR